MYKSFEIKNFRGFEELKINNLELINIIAGKNNAGKTVLLEALFLHCAAVNPSLVFSINAFRGMEKFTVETDPRFELPWNSVFSNYNIDSQIKLKGIDRDNKSRIVTLRTEKLRSGLLPVGDETGKMVPYALMLEHENDKKQKQKVQLILEQMGARIDPVLPIPFPAIFIVARRFGGPAEDADRFGKLKVAKEEKLLIESLKFIEPRLQSIDVIPRAGEPTLYGDIGSGRLIPLPLMGEGMVRLATIVLAIANARDGVVLLDEVENGFYHSIMTDIWKAIGKVASQFYTQIFATTHSLECIQAAHQAFKGSASYDLRVHRLDRNGTKTKVATYDQETLEASIQAGLEVR